LIFKVNLEFNWKKIKSGVELQFLRLNCINIEVQWAIKDLIEEIQNEGSN